MPGLASRRGRLVPSTRCTISPASSSTFRCCEIAGCVISNGLANSLTVASPRASRANIARRVGSARAANEAFRANDISDNLYKYRVIVKQKTKCAAVTTKGTKVHEGDQIPFCNFVLLCREDFSLRPLRSERVVLFTAEFAENGRVRRVRRRESTVLISAEWDPIDSD